MWLRLRQGHTEWPIPNTTAIYDTSIFQIHELRAYLKRAKRRKAPGPDELPMELLIELSDEDLSPLPHGVVSHQSVSDLLATTQ